ncbi:hypothetical protein SISSUDRAFT_1053459 [Sistotremastrum suecicum HHB10207 ss-3]|uniref:Extracellular membrane protein CFEM domain-containing protein n=1 Tax=Sistotremastrum suecicum HHB10207 ss-3 TaxID=1314776 RepID=A0A165Z722_9AGAM|nr:hypothetical protein SISSUDRAFT_1053459 [Sistotremastrum suecicum HHB10207 ss-3]
MRYILNLATFSLVIASHVFANFNVTFGNTFPTPSELINFPQGDWTSACSSNCTAIQADVQSCVSGTNDPTCFCTNSTFVDLQTCEQCLLNFLIEKNIEADPLVGSNPALSSYSTACGTFNITLQSLALATPPDWDGPTNVLLNTPATVVVVGFGAILGLSALYILSNLDVPSP